MNQIVLKARLGGACWLMCFLTSIFPLVVSGRLVVPRDAAATATNLLAHEALFRAGTAALLLSTGFYVAATLFVYEVLKAVNRSVSLLAAFFSLVGCGVGALSCVFDFVPFILLKGAPYLSVFTAEQLQALTYAFLAMRVEANNIGLVFFGLHCAGVGYLIVRSTFLPPVIGVLMLFAGLGWLTFLFPPLARDTRSIQHAPRRHWGIVADSVASDQKRERAAVVRPGKPGRPERMSAVPANDQLVKIETLPSTISPAQRTAARVIGVIYPLQMATGIFGEVFARGRLIVRGDAARTAENIMGAEGLFRLSIVTDLITYILVMVLTWALYVLLRPVNKNLALLGAFFRLSELAVLCIATVNSLVVLRLLSGAAYLHTFEPDQLRSVVMLAYQTQGLGMSVGFVLLGFGSAIFAYLLLRSRYVPKALATLGIIGALLLSIGTMAVILFPGLGVIGMTYMLPMGLYEVTLGLWLLIKGIGQPVRQETI